VLTAGCFQPEAAPLDDQAAILHVKQPGAVGNGTCLRRGDAQLQPQGCGPRRDGLAGDVRRLPGRPEHIDQRHRLGDVGAAVETVAVDAGFSVVREYVGHGIGTAMHEEPQVPNYGPPGRGLKLREGLVLAIEPMVNAGGPETELRDDGWTVVTRDGRRSAHFEHTIAVTDHGPEVLTLPW